MVALERHRTDGGENQAEDRAQDNKGELTVRTSAAALTGLASLLGPDAAALAVGAQPAWRPGSRTSQGRSGSAGTATERRCSPMLPRRRATRLVTNQLDAVLMRLADRS